MNWKAFNTGHSIGEKGSENGIVIRDEEYLDCSRITLEKDSPTAPFAITCGIYGWMVHTRYFPNHEQANLEFEQMKGELARIVLLLSNQKDKSENITSELKNFIAIFP